MIFDFHNVECISACLFREKVSSLKKKLVRKADNNQRKHCRRLAPKLDQSFCDNNFNVLPTFSPFRAPLITHTSNLTLTINQISNKRDRCIFVIGNTINLRYHIWNFTDLASAKTSRAWDKSVLFLGLIRKQFKFCKKYILNITQSQNDPSRN